MGTTRSLGCTTCRAEGYAIELGEPDVPSEHRLEAEVRPELVRELEVVERVAQVEMPDEEFVVGIQFKACEGVTRA